MRRINGFTVLFLALAVLWGAVQLVLAFFVHVTVRGHATSSGWVVPPAKTFMRAYGVSELVLTAVIMALAVTVGAALLRRATRGLWGAGSLAWSISVLTTLLGALGFVYLLGVGICLLLACVSVPRRPGATTAGCPPAPMAARAG